MKRTTFVCNAATIDLAALVEILADTGDPRRRENAPGEGRTAP